jgi:hypothetical protein
MLPPPVITTSTGWPVVTGLKSQFTEIKVGWRDIKGKRRSGKAIPVMGTGRRLPHFLDNQLTAGGKHVSQPMCWLFINPSWISGTNFCQSLITLSAILQLCQLKN